MNFSDMKIMECTHLFQIWGTESYLMWCLESLVKVQQKDMLEVETKSVVVVNILEPKASTTFGTRWRLEAFHLGRP